MAGWVLFKWQGVFILGNFGASVWLQTELVFAVCGLTFWSVAFVRLCIVCVLSFWFVGAGCSIFFSLFSPILGAVAGLGSLKRKVMLVSKINLTTNQYHRPNWSGR